MDTTELGAQKMGNRLCNPLPNSCDAKKYYRELFADYNALKIHYPYTKLFIPPTSLPYEAKLVVIAVGKDLIDTLHAFPEDFTDDYSKLIEVVIPYNYKRKGCQVYGGAWIDLNSLRLEDRHILGQLKDGRLKLCVGVPASFEEMENVILECVRTADNYLVAYEKYLKGVSKNLELLSYSHGETGKQQYVKDKKRYHTK